MNISPVISVVMPNFNQSNYLEKSIESILNQTFSDFELIIIDDASTDDSVSKIKPYLSDNRVKLIQSKYNVGNYNARNIGIDNSKGRYIAVMDADDTADVDRFTLQHNYLIENHLFCVGSQGYMVDHNGNFLNNLNVPQESDYIKIALLKNNCLTHSSLFYDKKALGDKGINRYQSDFIIAADYAFVTNSSFHFEIQNLSQRLVNYRIHDKQISSTKRDKQFHTARQVRLMQIKRLGLRPSGKEMYVYNHFMENSLQTEQELILLSSFLNKVLRRNEKAALYRQDLLFAFFQQLFNTAAANSKTGSWSFNDELIRYVNINFRDSKTILEFGSGAGTEFLLEKYDVISVENDSRFLLKRKRNHIIVHAPIQSGWYDSDCVSKIFNAYTIDLIIIDGPPGDLRAGIINNTQIFTQLFCPIIFDDVNRTGDKKVLENFCALCNYDFLIIPGEKKSFAICNKRSDS